MNLRALYARAEKPWADQRHRNDHVVGCARCFLRGEHECLNGDGHVGRSGDGEIDTRVRIPRQNCAETEGRMTAVPPRIDAEALCFAVDLLALLPPGANAKRIGKDKYKALCSFHDDKTPSMTVRFTARNGWDFRCYACGEHGRVVDYVMKTRGLAFRDALRSLASGNVGLEIHTPTKRRRPMWLLVCDGRGCTSSLEVEEEDRPYVGETFALAWWVGKHRAYCGRCLRGAAVGVGQLGVRT